MIVRQNHFHGQMTSMHDLIPAHMQPAPIPETVQRDTESVCEGEKGRRRGREKEEGGEAWFVSGTHATRCQS